MEKIALAFRLQRITESFFEHQDTCLTPSFLHNHSIRVGFSFSLQPNLEENLLTLNVCVNYHAASDGIEEIILRYGASFVFQIDHLSSSVMPMEPNAFSVKPDLLSLLFSIAIGSLRGMLAIRTAHTLLDDYPLPIINITELLASLRGNPLENRAISPAFRYEIR